MSEELIPKGYASNPRTAASPQDTDFLGIQQGTELLDMKKISYEDLKKPVVGEGWDGTTLKEVDDHANTLQDQVDALSVGGPKGVYDTLVDLQTADPDHTYTYVVEADGNWYFWNTTSSDWISGGVYNDSTAFNDLAGTGRTTETVKANADDIISIKGTGYTDGSLKTHEDRLDTLEGTGEGSVFKAIDDAQYLSKMKDVTPFGGNLYKYAEDIVVGRYYYNENGVLILSTSDSFTSFFLKINQNSIYNCDKARFAVLLNSNKQPINTAYLQQIESFSSGVAEYVVVSYLHGTYPNYRISEEPFLGSVEKIRIPSLFYNGQRRPYLQKYIGDYINPIALNEVQTSASNNVEFNVSADIGAIGSGKVILCIRTTTLEIEKFEVDATNITITDYRYGAYVVEVIAHGLTLQNNIQLHIKLNRGTKFNISLSSNGNTFVIAERGLDRIGVTYPELLCTGVVMTNISFSWVVGNITKPIWCFGDSYFGVTSDARWVYYLNQDGYYENHLFDNYGGERSSNSMASLISLLGKYIPKTIFWCLGMNDGTDDGTINVAWNNSKNSLIHLCTLYDIELIFATIPTVPTINHEYKNDWIRNSGYQYVDFAKAVGADSSGVWFSGMLSGDGVHPTAQGARALYNRVLSDFPQIQLNT